MIIAGDLEMVSEVFSAIDNLEKKVNGEYTENPASKNQYDDPKDRVKEGVDILTMDSNKDPKKA